eukprot:5344485-Pleurochrysis_carterae.AAC.3
MFYQATRRFDQVKHARDACKLQRLCCAAARRPRGPLGGSAMACPRPPLTTAEGKCKDTPKACANVRGGLCANVPGSCTAVCRFLTTFNLTVRAATSLPTKARKNQHS